jgi:G3E family GTPase
MAFGVWLSMLLRCHGQRILRVKGILDVIDASQPIVIHGVQHSLHPPVHLPAWPAGERRSRLVFIVRELDTALLRRSFAAFMGGLGRAA